MKYKLVFKHYRTEELIEKIVKEVDFNQDGDKVVFYSINDKEYIDVIKESIVSYEVIL